jgi:hypothetical protein
VDDLEALQGKGSAGAEGTSLRPFVKRIEGSLPQVVVNGPCPSKRQR